MNKLILSMGGAVLVGLMLAATVVAADPTPVRMHGSDGAIATILGLTRAEIADLRQDGLSLAQIAERQKVDPQKLVDALAARWTVRIDARVQAGGLTAAEATQLRSQVELRARDMVYRTTVGGMHGAAVGAGPGAGMGAGMGNGMAGRGMGMGAGNGTGECDGTGPHGAGRD